MHFKHVAPINITDEDGIIEKNGLSIVITPVIIGGPNTYVLDSNRNINDTWPKNIEVVVRTNTSGKIILVGSTYNFAEKMDTSYMQDYLTNLLSWLFGSVNLEYESPIHVQVLKGKTIVIKAKNTGYVRIRAFNLTFQSSDYVYLNATQFYEDEINVNDTITFALEVTTSKMGTYDIQVFYRAGGIDETMETLRISSEDMIKPVVEITSPSNGSIFSSNLIELKFNATDNYELDKIEISVDGVLVKTLWTSSSEFNTSIKITLEEGEHTFSVKAYDRGGNFDISKIGVIVDQTPPELEIIRPSNNSKVPFGEVKLNLTISDAYGLSSITVSVDGQKIFERELSENSESIEIALNLSVGEHEILIEAIDSAGNIRKVNIFITAEDTISPIVVIYSPSNGTEIEGTEFKLNISVSDNYQLRELLIRINGETVYQKNITGKEYSEIVTLQYQTGEHTIEVIATDVANNTGKVFLILHLIEAEKGLTLPLEALIAVAGIAGGIVMTGILIIKRRGAEEKELEKLQQKLEQVNIEEIELDEEI